ncbi:MAG TPA: hypothetical protein VM029_11440 [Opitutaceae bacterium]|nr:hypothetical protein [Opitutaceae bacterium]
MSRFGLSPRFLSATLFIAIGLRAQDPMQPAPGAMAKDSKRAQEMMKRYDKNGDGRIDDDERADAQEAMLKERVDRQVQVGVGAPEALRVRMIEVFDKNRDGRLDDDERAAAMEYAPGVNPALRGEIMRRFDRNGDGKIDDEERATLLSFLAEGRTAAPERTAAVVVSVTPAEAQARAEAVAKEVARRRALRGEAMAANGPAVLSATDRDEQARLERVAEEVRKRRLERERKPKEMQGK